MARRDQAPIRLEAERCLHSLNKDAACTACVDVCPVDALALTGSVTLDATTCVACGACLPICPTGAFSGNEDVAGLLQCAVNLEPGTPVELACAYHPTPEQGSSNATVVRTTACLAALGPGAYLALFSAGVRHVGVRMDGCEECPLRRAAAAIPGTVDTANALLARCDLAGSITLLENVAPCHTRPVHSVKNPPLSRRGLFRVLANEGSRQAARLLSSETAPAGVRGPSCERRRLVAALRHLPLRAEDSPLEGLPFARYAVNEQCTACAVCARVCPTNALRFNDDETGGYQLSFAPAACIDCDLCIHVCMPAALERSPATLAELVDDAELILTAGRLRTCPKCKARYAARQNEPLCPPCTFRRTHPFGSRMPPGMRHAAPSDAPASQSE